MSDIKRINISKKELLIPTDKSRNIYIYIYREREREREKERERGC